MNLFASSENPIESARALADRHVVKMAVETAQVLWTALHLSAPGRVPEGGYRPTHRGHPCVQWAAASRGNFDWAVQHGLALCEEYQHRYGKVHGSRAATVAVAPLDGLVPSGMMTPFAIVMDDELRDPMDPHRSYIRCLSRKYTAWGTMARWTRRDPPVWWAHRDGRD